MPTDLNELLALRASGSDSTPRHNRLLTFGDVVDEWLATGCPSSSAGGGVRHAKGKSPNTIANARTLLKTPRMCGLRPGELVGLRRRYVDIDSREPSIEVAERINEVGHKFVGQTRPKTRRSQRRIGLHPLLVGALAQHRDEMKLLGRYDLEGSVFCNNNGTPFLLTNLRRYFRALCDRADLPGNWTP